MNDGVQPDVFLAGWGAGGGGNLLSLFKTSCTLRMNNLETGVMQHVPIRRRLNEDDSSVVSRPADHSVCWNLDLNVYKIDYSSLYGKPDVGFKCLKKLVGERGFQSRFQHFVSA